MEGAPFCAAPALVAGRTGLKPRCYCDPKPADAGSSHPASGCSTAAASVPDRALRLQDLTPLGLIRNVESRLASWPKLDVPVGCCQADPGGSTFAQPSHQPRFGAQRGILHCQAGGDASVAGPGVQFTGETDGKRQRVAHFLGDPNGHGRLRCGPDGDRTVGCLGRQSGEPCTVDDLLQRL